MTASMKPAGATRPCLHQGNRAIPEPASQCAMALNLRAGSSCNGPAETRSSGITSIPVSLSRTASSRASTAHCAMSCLTKNCSTTSLTPAGSWHLALRLQPCSTPLITGKSNAYTSASDVRAGR